MNYQTNPFLQHALRHGRVFMDESSKAAELSRLIVSGCDEIIAAIHSGNMQGALYTAHNVRNTAVEISNATQELNNIISERLEMGVYVMNRIQHHVNELANAFQNMMGQRQYSTYQGFRPDLQHCGMTMQYTRAGSPVM